MTKEIHLFEKFLQKVELLTTSQVAEFCQLNKQTVRRYVREGKIKHVRIGNHIRIRPLALEEFLKENEVEVIK
jgi:excisionase family DNA binding protein